MAKVMFRNMKHGEYISIGMKTKEDGGSLTIIRDFGSACGALTPYLRKEADKLISCGDTIDTVLSHAHLDHYKGFKLMHEKMYKKNSQISKKPFRRAFIPYLRYKDVKDLGAVMLKVGLCYLFLMRPSSKASRGIKNWIKMTPIMYDLADELVGVEQGYVFPDWEQKGTVLWPAPPSSTYYKSLVDNIITDIDQLQSNLSTEDRTILEQTWKLLCEDFAKMIEENNLGLLPTALEQINSHLTPFLEQCKSSQLYLKKANTNIHKMYAGFSNNIDDHSIVFSLNTIDEKDGALFLSDLNETPMNNMCQFFKENKEYKIIKSAHHGSRLGCQFAKSNKAGSVVHCCGEGHNSSYGPDPLYLKITNDIICTDWVNNNPKWRCRNLYNILGGKKHLHVNI